MRSPQLAALLLRRHAETIAFNPFSRVDFLYDQVRESNRPTQGAPELQDYFACPPHCTMLEPFSSKSQENRAPYMQRLLIRYRAQRHICFTRLSFEVEAAVRFRYKERGLRQVRVITYS